MPTGLPNGCATWGAVSVGKTLVVACATFAAISEDHGVGWMGVNMWICGGCGVVCVCACGGGVCVNMWVGVRA